MKNLAQVPWRNTLQRCAKLFGDFRKAWSDEAWTRMCPSMFSGLMTPPAKWWRAMGLLMIAFDEGKPMPTS
jgi:hypothetical protein